MEFSERIREYQALIDEVEFILERPSVFCLLAYLKGGFLLGIVCTYPSLISQQMH
jgi:hypothetical protein